MVAELDVCFYGTTSDRSIAEKPLEVVADGSKRILETKGPAGEGPKRLAQASVLTFDVYGTLVDRETGIVNALMPWLHGVGVTAGRGEIVRAFAQAERSHLQPGRCYRDVLVRVHDSLAEFFDVGRDRKAAEEFAASIGRWPIHPEVPAALAYLKQHYRLVVMTNTDRAMFDITNGALGVDFDTVYTAEEAGVFKPSTGAFEYLLGRLDEARIAKSQVIHVAGSIRFDHVPAKRLGMTTCWINRKQGQSHAADGQKRSLDIHPDFRFSSLGGLADAHWSETRKQHVLKAV